MIYMLIASLNRRCPTIIAQGVQKNQNQIFQQKIHDIINLVSKNSRKFINQFGDFYQVPINLFFTRRTKSTLTTLLR